EAWCLNPSRRRGVEREGHLRLRCLNWNHFLADHQTWNYLGCCSGPKCPSQNEFGLVGSKRSCVTDFPEAAVKKLEGHLPDLWPLDCLLKVRSWLQATAEGLGLFCQLCNWLPSFG